MASILNRARWAIESHLDRAREARQQEATAAEHQKLADGDGVDRAYPPEGSIPYGQRVHHVRYGDGRYVEDDINIDGGELWSGTGCFPAAGDHYDFDRPIDDQDPQRFQLHGAMHRDLLIIADEEIDEP